MHIFDKNIPFQKQDFETDILLELCHCTVHKHYNYFSDNVYDSISIVKHVRKFNMRLRLHFNFP